MILANDRQLLRADGRTKCHAGCVLRFFPESLSAIPSSEFADRSNKLQPSGKGHSNVDGAASGGFEETTRIIDGQWV